MNKSRQELSYAETTIHSDDFLIPNFVLKASSGQTLALDKYK